MQKLIESAINTFQIEAEGIANLSCQLTDDFVKAVNLINSNMGRVVVSGIGKSGIIGTKIAATLNSTGTPAIFMHPVEAIHGDLGMLTKEDIFIAISTSGETEEMIRLIPIVKELGIALIAIAGNPNSTLARAADLFLNVCVENEACPFQLVPTASTTAALAMGDALAVALMKEKHFTPTDFASRHPGGSLGKKLITRVKDVMCRTHLPLINTQTKFKDIITAISTGMKGIAVVIDTGGIAGTITDGDIRRTINGYNGDALNKTAAEIMTVEPVTISEDAMLIDAEKMMHDNKIVSLLVVSAEDKCKLEGIIQRYGIGV
jgi:arabinose-5-phosphate isomerase